MMADWTMTIWAILLTTLSFILVAKFGTRPLAIAMVWIISRLPGHAPYKCPVFHLEPLGPWPGVCEKACPMRPGPMAVRMIDACNMMSMDQLMDDALDESEICPVCSKLMEFDGDGYWCPKCEEYYPPDILDQYKEG